MSQGARADELAPYFDDLARGQVDAGAPALTLTDGHAAVHQAIVGDRLRLALDAALAAEVLGEGARLAHPGLVCDIAIGQSTRLTQRVVGNLFYRGLVFHRLPLIGDTLRTTTEVVALRQNSPRPARAATGMAALRIRTVDQEDRPVLDFHRCAMLPVRDPDSRSGPADDLGAIGSPPDPAVMSAALGAVDMDRYRAAVSPAGAPALAAGRSFQLDGGDVVTAAPELARLSLNIAFAHHDAAAGRDGRRLVYGGHTIGIAAAQLSRALPDLVTVLGWESCDHLGPVFEGDTLRSTVDVDDVNPLAGGGGIAKLRSRVVAEGGGEVREVLDWRLFGAVA
jgi:acyl dehydratase